MENTMFNNEELFLQELFAVESEQDDITNMISYQVTELAIINYESIIQTSEMFSLESLADKISFNKSRLLIMFKKFLGELIKVVLEFFGVGVTQKKILLMMSKNIDNSIKSVKKTFANRMSQKGRYDFGDKPIDIRDTYKTILTPICTLMLVATSLLIDVNGYFDKKSKVDSSTLMHKAASLKEGEASKIQQIVNKIASTQTKSAISCGILGNLDKFNITVENIDEGFKRNALAGKVDVYLGALKNINAISTENFISTMTTAFGLHDPTVDINLALEMGLFDRNSVEEMFSTQTISNIKEYADKMSENVNDIMAKMTDDIDDISIDSSAAFENYISNLLQFARSIAAFGKNINFEKELTKIRKEIDMVQKEVNKLSDEGLDFANTNFNILQFITTTTYQYNVSKNLVNKCVRASVKLVDNGLTDVKKVEAAIS